MSTPDGLDVLLAYLAAELPHHRLVSSDVNPIQQRALLTLQEVQTGKQHVLEVHEDFYMDRLAEVVRDVLKTWDVAGVLRNGARKVRIREESFEVLERYQ